jgi:hypothetical protein
MRAVGCWLNVALAAAVGTLSPWEPRVRTG